ncbi:MAG TPA: alkaline phosphatase family protein [Candidatus Eremiobacteraceae bacterium]
MKTTSKSRCHHPTNPNISGKRLRMWNNSRFILSLCAVVALAAGCGGSHSVAALPGGAGLQTHRKAITLPKYVIIMVQENRTIDNLFQKQPGVDTQNYGMDSHGNRIALKKVDLGGHYSCSHSHAAFVKSATIGFDVVNCGKAPPDFAFSYVKPDEIKPYTALATQYAIADEVLQSNQGPSFPAHIYLIAGTTGTPGSHWNIAEDDYQFNHIPAGCNAPPSQKALQIDMTTAFPGVEGNAIFPCINPPTIFNELDSAQISWKYYTPNANFIWTAPTVIQSLYQTDAANIIVPETTILSDIQNGHLSQVSYVIPRYKNSDHPGVGINGGPTWVASVVNALGASQYWNQCAVIVTWDDWGGWYDHVAYRHPASNPVDPYEYGFRVPLLAIGPSAKPNFVDHTQRDFSAIPHFIEDVYGLGSLGALDAQTDDLFSMFNFGAAARKFTPIPTGNVTIKSLLSLPPDPSPVDPDDSM